jgi:hypothetical protein
VQRSAGPGRAGAGVRGYADKIVLQASLVP